MNVTPALPATQEHWLRYRDCSIAAYECAPANSRGLLVFLHGRFGSSAIWSRVAQQLKGSFRCLFLDFPGFGDSFSIDDRGLTLSESADLVIQVIEQLGSDGPVVLVGHDTGAAIAQVCAHRNPERVSALVMLNAACLVNELPEASLAWRGWIMQWRLHQLLRSSKNLSRESRLGLLRPWQFSASRNAMLNALGALEHSWPDDSERLAWRESIVSFQRPVLLLWGARDQWNPPRNAFETVQRLPDSHFFQNDLCGHWPCLEQPNWVIAKMKDFLFRIPLRRKARPAARRIQGR